MNQCEKCPYLVNVFSNYVECIKLHRFVDWEYWNNYKVEDCPLKKGEEE